MYRILVLAALLFAFPAHAVVTIEWVTVGDPGNACDTQSQGCFGTVSYEYQIGKYEVSSSTLLGSTSFPHFNQIRLFGPHAA